MRFCRFLPLATIAALAASATLHAASPTPLADKLQAMTEASAKRLPEPMRAKFAQGIADVQSTGILDKARQVGANVPDATLLGVNGEPVQLATLWADQPVVLTFYRGGWCPYCNASLQALQKALASIEGAGAKLVAVAPERADKVAQTTANNKVTFTALSDPGNALAGQLGIAFKLPEVILPIYRDRLKLAEYNGDQQYTLPLAATYVVDTSGVIRWAFLDADYKKRAEPADIVAAVQQVSGAAASPAGPEPLIPHRQLAREVGVWDAEMTLWMAPAAPPLVAKAVETNTMLGGFWLISEFQCESEQMPFQGRMHLGYDPQKEKFVGMWIDSMSPNGAYSEGDYDIATRTLTLVANSTNCETGEPETMTMITRYTGEETKVFTIHEGDQGAEGWKMMEIRYTRRK